MATTIETPTLVSQVRSRRELIEDMRTRFREQRDRRRWSRRYVAGILESSISAVQNFEDGRARNHSDDFLEMVAEVIDRWEKEARLHDAGIRICEPIKAAENFRFLCAN